MSLRLSTALWLQNSRHHSGSWHFIQVLIRLRCVVVRPAITRRDGVERVRRRRLDPRRCKRRPILQRIIYGPVGRILRPFRSEFVSVVSPAWAGVPSALQPTVVGLVPNGPSTEVDRSVGLRRADRYDLRVLMHDTGERLVFLDGDSAGVGLVDVTKPAFRGITSPSGSAFSWPASQWCLTGRTHLVIPQMGEMLPLGRPRQAL